MQLQLGFVTAQFAKTKKKSSVLREFQDLSLLRAQNVVTGGSQSCEKKEYVLMAWDRLFTMLINYLRNTVIAEWQFSLQIEVIQVSKNKL